MEGKLSVLFVCMGNYCRSPAAEAVARHMIEKKRRTDLFYIDSAGTHSYHVDEEPDPRMQKEGRERGYELLDIRGRQITPQDFRSFQYILAMDKRNLNDLEIIKNHTNGTSAELLLNYSESESTEVPDPYYSNKEGFSTCLDLIEVGVSGFIEFAIKNHRIHPSD